MGTQEHCRAIEKYDEVRFQFLIGTTIGCWAVRDAPEIYKFALLSFARDILMTVAVEEMMAHAHAAQEGEESGFQMIGRAAGFRLFILLSGYLE